MEYTMELNSKEIIMEHDDFKDRINLEDLTKINPSNIFGDASTISSDIGKLGLMKSEIYSDMQSAKLAISVYEADYVKALRSEASKNSGKYKITVDGTEVEIKLTETALKTCFESEEEWIELQEHFIKMEKYWNYLDVIYWSAKDKSGKLKGMVATVNPELYKEEVEKESVKSVLTK